MDRSEALERVAQRNISPGQSSLLPEPDIPTELMQFEERREFALSCPQTSGPNESNLRCRWPPGQDLPSATLSDTLQSTYLSPVHEHDDFSALSEFEDGLLPMQVDM